ncbi:MAG: preprotein translocase subunit YajC [Nocardioidaceae bacterium]
MQNLGAFLPLILIVVLFWVLVIRPSRKRQQQLSATQSGLEPGTDVMLGSGIFGTVVSVADETVQIEIAPGTQMKVARQAVVRVVEQPAVSGPATDGDSTTPPPADPASEQD